LKKKRRKKEDEEFGRESSNQFTIFFFRTKRAIDEMPSPLLLRQRHYAFVPPRAQLGGPQRDGVVGSQQPQEQTIASPFAEIQRIRKVKRLGIGLSAAFFGSAAAVAAWSGVLPTLPPELPRAAAAASSALAAASGLTLAAAKASLRERLHLELEGARLYVEVLPEFSTGVSSPSPSSSSPSSSDSSSSAARLDGRPFLVVRDASDGRGRGVYVREEEEGEQKEEGAGTEEKFFLPRGSFLGCYEGDLLSEEEFWRRYPRGVGDYCIGCGGGFCLDGAPLAEELRGRSSREENNLYSPCLINHSSKRSNLSRITRRKEKKVELYASRDLFPGEELLLDYGRKYWEGREGEERD